MRELSERGPVLLAAAFLHVPARRQRGILLDQEQTLAEWIAEDTSKKVAHARHRAKEAAQRIHRLGARIVSIVDADYPAGLLDLPDPPAFLCVRGTLPQGGIAIIGSRNAPAPALELAREVARGCGRPVISGLARGIDGAAHRGALDAGMPTLAYVGTGLGLTYPPEHRELEEEIVARGGCIATERLPGEPVAAWALVHRDRLQAAHARAVFLIASEIDGGAMQTMQFAAALNRPRFAFAGPEFAFSGNAAAVAHGARALAPSPGAALDAIAHAP